MAQPQAASEFYAEQQQRKLAVLVTVDRLWSTIKPEGNWSEQFQPLSVLMGEVIGRAQEDVAKRAQEYADALARETGIGVDRVADINPAGFGGWNGDGRTIEQGLGYAVARAGSLFSETEALTKPTDFDAEQVAREALEAGRRFAAEYVSTALADTARAAVSATQAARPEIEGYIRMLRPPSCSRCVVLAGKWFKWNTGFERHPKCDCFHVPANEIKDPLAPEVNPDYYFHSLTEAEQDKIFTNAGAQAIRDGADISQVVNARSGMRTAQDFRGQNVKITLDGTTKRAWFGGGYAARKYGDTEWFNQFGYATTDGRRRTTAMRLMPETIYGLASDREEAIRLLKRYGFFV